MKKDPASIASSAIDNARTTSIIEQGRKDGLSESDIVFKALGGDEGIADLAINMDVLLCLRAIACAVTMETEGLNQSPVFRGYALNLQHYTSHPEAIAFTKLLRNDITKGELFEYYLRMCDITEDVLLNNTSVDRVWFDNLLKTKAGDSRNVFGFSESHAKQVEKLLYQDNRKYEI